MKNFLLMCLFIVAVHSSSVEEKEEAQLVEDISKTLAETAIVKGEELVANWRNGTLLEQNEITQQLEDDSNKAFEKVKPFVKSLKGHTETLTSDEAFENMFLAVFKAFVMELAFKSAQEVFPSAKFESGFSPGKEVKSENAVLQSISKAIVERSRNSSVELVEKWKKNEALGKKEANEYLNNIALSTLETVNSKLKQMIKRISEPLIGREPYAAFPTYKTASLAVRKFVKEFVFRQAERMKGQKS